MWACFQGKGSKGVCYSGSVDTRRQTRHNQAQLASRKCLPLYPPGWRKTPAPVNGIVRLCQQSLRLLILLLICLAGLSSPAHASSIPVNVTGFSPISLTDHLLPINAPSALIAPDDPASKDTVQWFRFTLQNNDDLQKRWILAFREVPYTFLNVYTMTPTGFTLTELGVSNTQHHHGKDGTAIVLPPPPVNRYLLFGSGITLPKPVYTHPLARGYPCLEPVKELVAYRLVNGSGCSRPVYRFGQKHFHKNPPHVATSQSYGIATTPAGLCSYPIICAVTRCGRPWPLDSGHCHDYLPDGFGLLPAAS